MEELLFVGGSINGERRQVRDHTHQIFIPVHGEWDDFMIHSELYVRQTATLGIPDVLIAIEIMVCTSEPKAQIYADLLKIIAPQIGGEFKDLRQPARIGDGRA